MTRSTAFQTLALSVLITSGCQATLPLHAMKQPIFALGQQGGAGEVAIAARPTQGVGGLTVSFKGELAQWTRRVLATVADVEKVVVTVKPVGAPEMSQTVLKAALASGQIAVTFQGLPPGNVNLTITAFDVSGQNIGSTTKVATVAVGQTAVVDVALQLGPTYVTGSGGAGASTTGGLTTNVTLQDGPIVTPLPGGGVLETHVMPFQVHAVASNGDDDIWALGAIGQSNVLAKIATNGAITRQIMNVGVMSGSLCVDGDGDVWVLTSAPDGGLVLNEIDGNGQTLRQFDLPSIFGFDHVRMDNEGNAYFFGGPFGGGVRWSQDGTVTPISTIGSTVTPGSLNDLWIGVLNEYDPITSIASPDVARYSKDGQLLGRYSVGAGYRAAYTAIDQLGNAWVTAMRSEFVSGSLPMDGRLVKFSPQGQLLGTFELTNGGAANAVEIGSDGRIWVVAGGGGAGTVTWFDATGVELGHVPLAKVHPWQFAATANGAWVVDHQANAIIHVSP